MKWLRKFKLRGSGKNNSLSFSKKLSYKDYIRIQGNDNSIKLGENFNIKSLSIIIQGNHNNIFIGNNLECLQDLIIEVVGDYNSIILGSNIRIIEKLKILNLQECQRGCIKINDHCSFYNSEIHLYDNDSQLEIGEDSIFANNVVIHATDGHGIFQNGKLINQAKKCTIGKHCWLGRNVLVLKNSEIPDGCIVGANTTICKKFNIPNSIITDAGIIKKNIQWTRASVNEVLNNES